MTRIIRLILIGWVLSFPATTTAGTTDGEPDRVAWRGEPIEISLARGQERVIRVPGASGLRAGLIGGPVPGLRVQPLGDRIFVTAAAPFRSTRMLVRTNQGDTLMLDLRATDDQGPLPPIEIALPRSPSRPATTAEATLPATGTGESDTRARKEGVGYQRLVRHAAQTLYGPRRLSPNTPGIARVPLTGGSETAALIRGGCCVARPVIAWRAEGPHGPLWLTAVTVRNRLDGPRELDPRTDIRGTWLAVSAQAWRLGPAGTDVDATTLYLISSRPWRQAIGFIRALEPPRADEPGVDEKGDEAS